MPELSSVFASRRSYLLYPKHILRWRDGDRISCESGVLSQFRPILLRQYQLLSIIHWTHTESGMILVDFSNPNELRISQDWVNGNNSELFGVHSGTLQTVEVRGIAVRAGRRYFARLQTSPYGLEVRVLAYSSSIGGCRASTYIVHPPQGDWSDAEAYDSCTIYGRILLRQYDDSSGSEDSVKEGQINLALLDFNSYDIIRYCTTLLTVCLNFT